MAIKQKAKAEFLEMNKDLVKIYNGVKKEWKGNKFFYPDDVVKIPKFDKTENPEQPEKPTQPEQPAQPPKANEEKIVKKVKIPIQEVIPEITQEQLDEIRKMARQPKIKPEKLKEAIISKLDVTFDVDVDNNKIVIKDKDGKVIKEFDKPSEE